MNLVSVIVPTYNRSEFLVESINSIFEQTHRPIEVLIIDDGSIDDTEFQIIKLKDKFEKEDFKIIYKYQKNKGSNFARNVGLKLASGEWVQFLDSDDLLEKNKLKMQIKALIKKNSDMAICDNKKIQKDMISLFKNDGNLLWRLSCGYSVHISAILFKKELLRNISWNIKLYREQDKEFVYKAILQSKKYVYIEKALSFYRMHNNSQISDNYSKTPLQTFENIKSDLSLIFSKDYRLDRYKVFFIFIHILYLLSKLFKRNLKYFLFRKYSLK